MKAIYNRGAVYFFFAAGTFDIHDISSVGKLLPVFPARILRGEKFFLILPFGRKTLVFVEKMWYTVAINYYI